jgi:hypothetical protein
VVAENIRRATKSSTPCWQRYDKLVDYTLGFREHCRSIDTPSTGVL